MQEKDISEYLIVSTYNVFFHHISFIQIRKILYILTIRSKVGTSFNSALYVYNIQLFLNFHICVELGIRGRRKGSEYKVHQFLIYCI
jgi:hypothetical protein